jgi:hypothetical protein
MHTHNIQMNSSPAVSISSIMKSILFKSKKNTQMIEILDNAFAFNQNASIKHATKYVGTKSGGNTTIANGDVKTENEQNLSRKATCDFILSLP